MIEKRPYVHLAKLKGAPNLFQASVIIDLGMKYEILSGPTVIQPPSDARFTIHIALTTLKDKRPKRKVFQESINLLVNGQDQLLVQVDASKAEGPAKAFANILRFSYNNKISTLKPHVLLQHLNQLMADEVYILNVVSQDTVNRKVKQAGAPQCAGESRVVDHEYTRGGAVGGPYYLEAPEYMIYPDDLCTDADGVRIESRVDCRISESGKDGKVVVQHADADDQPWKLR
jgi:hypothetical protein